MSRNAHRASIRPLALVLGVLVPIGLLIGVFALASPRLLTGKWPFGIKQNEVRWFAQLKGGLVEEVRTIEVPIYRIGGNAESCWSSNSDSNWSGVGFETNGYSGEVQLAHRGNGSGSFSLRFPASLPFELQHGVDLLPASIESIRNKYLEVLATELGIPVPEISFVRVIACGKDLGIFQKEETMDRSFLAKKRLSDATLFYASIDPDVPQQMFPGSFSDSLMEPEVRALWTTMYAGLARGGTEACEALMDEDGTIAWLLMRWLENGDPSLADAVPYMHRRTTGSISPLFKRSLSHVGDRKNASTMDPALALLAKPTVQKALQTRREKLIEVRWRLKERFAAIDREWLPVLAQKGDLAWAGAIAARIADGLLEVRLGAVNDQNGPLVYHSGHWTAGPGRVAFVGTGSTSGPLVVQATDGTTPLEDVARQFFAAKVIGDTLFLNRGKYTFKEDLILPPGKTLVITEGARITMAPGSGITVQGSLHVRASRLRPVFLRAMDDSRPFNAIAVRGDGSAVCKVSGLYISGGGAQGAMVSVRGTLNTTFEDCEMETAAGHVLEIGGGSASMQDMNFYGGSGPLLVLDHVRSIVRKSMFRKGKRMVATDGLSVLGERALVEECAFIGMSGSAISVGDAGQLFIRNGHFEDNGKAINGKDLASIHVSGNKFKSNGTVFELRRIDPVQGGARVILYKNVLIDNQNERAVDEYSGIETQEAPDAKVLADFGAE